MKSIKEKAEAYDEAIKKAESLYKAAEPMSGCNVIIETLFPELSESEDEKVIKEIIELVMQPTWKTEEEFHRRNVLCAWLENVPVTIDHEKREGFHLGYKACLEKRGEQKPADSYCQENCKGFQETGKCFADGECKAKRESDQNLAENAKPQSSTPMSYGKELEKRMYEACNRFFAPNTDSNRYSASDLFYAGVKAERDLNTLAWSEEDETVLNNLIYALENDRIGNNRDEYVDWLKSIKSRVQPKQEWNEEDKYMYDILCGTIENTDINENTKYTLISWLKSLRPQNHWKPTNEQMGCLSDAIEHYNSLGYPAPKLKELLDDLKKLKEGKV